MIAGLQLRDVVYAVFIVVAFLISWRLGTGALEKRNNIWFAIALSVASSALILLAAGYFSTIAEPDEIGKGLVPFVFFIIFVIVTLFNVALLFAKKNGRNRKGSVL